MSISFCRYFSKNQFWNSFEHLNATDNGKCSFLQILQIFLQKKSRSVSQEFWNESAVQLDDPYIDHFVAEETSLKFPFKFMNRYWATTPNREYTNIKYLSILRVWVSILECGATLSRKFMDFPSIYIYWARHQHFWTIMSWHIVD